MFQHGCIFLPSLQGLAVRIEPFLKSVAALPEGACFSTDVFFAVLSGPSCSNQTISQAYICNRALKGDRVCIEDQAIAN